MEWIKRALSQKENPSTLITIFYIMNVRTTGTRVFRKSDSFKDVGKEIECEATVTIQTKLLY